MDNKELRITVAGLPNSGKTTVARLIEDSLKGLGFTDISVEDVDPTPNKPVFAERLRATLNRKITIYVIPLRNGVESSTSTVTGRISSEKPHLSNPPREE
jgi:hypothetical protein